MSVPSDATAYPAASESQASILVINDDLAVGAVLPHADERGAAWRGYASVLDVHDIRDRSGIRETLLAADESAEAGRTYAWRPLNLDQDDAIDEILAEFQRLPKPVYVYDQKLEGALAVGLIASAEFHSAGQVIARMAARGAPVLDEKLSAAVRAWFERRGAEPKAPESIVAFD